MKLCIFSSAQEANAAAATCLAEWLTRQATRNVMLAAGNTPLELYRRIGVQGLPLSHLHLFALDEYVGVPLDEPRNCANLLRRSAAEAWEISPTQFHAISSLENNALTSVLEHERCVAECGGVDVVILGLGQNGHLGFNEPGSAEESIGRLVELDLVSVEANRQWFSGDYAPSVGVTAGLKTILGARHVLLMAYGSHKAGAVKAMLDGPRSGHCPASFLQGHPDTQIFLDEAAAALIERKKASG